MKQQSRQLDNSTAVKFTWVTRNAFRASVIFHEPVLVCVILVIGMVCSVNGNQISWIGRQHEVRISFLNFLCSGLGGGDAFVSLESDNPGGSSSVLVI